LNAEQISQKIHRDTAQEMAGSTAVVSEAEGSAAIDNVSLELKLIDPEEWPDVLPALIVRVKAESTSFTCSVKVTFDDA
jgi:hypothetical protein